ncbi:hypothetical protein HID58_058963 [Brassica napus]|uniref:Reverse transcriptase zinc-binding domain-containing protein n=1 Tax=Brassica napus TaxID=3708 RepID=A0ABQ7ZRJ6_BRANA|nr:hypothetical protein HID58_058963 [Brassica napus]
MSLPLERVFLQQPHWRSYGKLIIGSSHLQGPITKLEYTRFCFNSPSQGKLMFMSGVLVAHKKRDTPLDKSTTCCRNNSLRFRGIKRFGSQRESPSIDGACLFCNSSLETRSHLFFDCSFSWDIWSSLIHRMQHQSPCSWLEILDFLHNFAGTKAERYLLLLTWQATIYALWTERNHRLHRNNYRSASSLTSDIDRTIKRRIASIRPDDPQLSSVMLTLWFASSLPPPVIST